MLSSESFKVDRSPSLEIGVVRDIGFLGRYEAGGPYGMSPSLFKGDSELLTMELIKPLESKWTREQIPEDWCESVIISIYNKGDRSSFGNPRGISLVSIPSKLLTSIILCPISSLHNSVPPSGRGSIDQIFGL